MERQPSPHKESLAVSHARTLELLKRGIQEGAHSKVPHGVSEESWVRLRNIGGVYHGSPATYEDLGRQYGVTREAIRIANKKFINLFRDNCSVQLQADFPLEQLSIRKPLSQRSKENLSKSIGGTSARIKEQIEEGVTDLDVIAQKLNTTTMRLRTARPVLRRWGINIPRKTVSYKQLEKDINVMSDQEIQAVLDRLSANSLRDYMTKKGKSGVFVSLRRIIEDVGFTYDVKQSRFFFRLIQESGIPVRKIEAASKTKHKGKEYSQVYYVVLAKYRNRILKVLEPYEQ